jgi:hypothetical protein
MLGQGNFSKVFRVKCKFDGMEYAVKRSFRAVTSELEARQWQQARSRRPLVQMCAMLVGTLPGAGPRVT